MARQRLTSGQEAEGEMEGIHRDGRPLVLWCTETVISGADGRPRRASFVMDITERKQTEQRLAHAAYHDALTGLPNRVLFDDRLEQALHAAWRDQAQVALLLLDLDGFKQVNDTHGHEAGDTLLRVVAKRLQACARGRYRGPAGRG